MHTVMQHYNTHALPYILILMHSICIYLPWTITHVHTYTITQCYRWPMDLMDRKGTQTDHIRYQRTVSNRS